MRKSIIVIGLFALFIGWRLSAQFNAVHQPMFANAPTAGAQDYATNLAYRWVHTNLMTNVQFGSWTDVVSGFKLGTYGTMNMTNTTSGVLFASAGNALTNQSGSDKYLVFNPTPNVTNWAMGMIWRFAPNQNFDSVRKGFTLSGAGGTGSRYRFDLNSDNGYMAVSKAIVTWLETWPNNAAATPATNWYDMVVSVTNDSSGVLWSVHFLNGAYSTNWGAGSAWPQPMIFGLFDPTHTTPDSDPFGMRGWIREIWVATNSLLIPGRLEGMAADIHWVRTNIYQNP